MTPRVPIAVVAIVVLAACTGPGGPRPSTSTGSEIEFEGRIESIDLAPWAYDGNARLVVRTTSQGELAVELPARWNLCRATGIGEAASFAAGHRVRVAGTMTAPGTVTVCERATHRIARLP